MSTNRPEQAALTRDTDLSKTDETRAVIEQTSDEKTLAVQTIDWRAASGLVGQFITAVQAVLVVSIMVIFLVALVIINNSMMMATMERFTEIGTMRAIGAQSRFVLLLFLLETVFLGLIAGTLRCVASPKARSTPP